MWQRTVLLTCFVLAGLSTLAHGRTWTDSPGGLSRRGRLIAFNDTTVVLKKKNRQLVAVPIVKLSKDDQTYLAVERGCRPSTSVRRRDADVDNGVRA